MGDETVTKSRAALDTIVSDEIAPCSSQRNPRHVLQNQANILNHVVGDCTTVWFLLHHPTWSVMNGLVKYHRQAERVSTNQHSRVKPFDVSNTSHIAWNCAIHNVMTKIYAPLSDS